MPKFNNIPNKHIVHEGKDYWIGRSVACTCIVAIATDNPNDTKYLMGLRGPSMTDFPFHWNIIAGYLDGGESAKDCVRRELWEESGIDYDLEKNNILKEFLNQPWYVNSDPCNNRQNVTLDHAIILNSYPKIIINNEGDGEEVLDLQWFTPSELVSIKDKTAFKHYEKIMDFHNLHAQDFYHT